MPKNYKYEPYNVPFKSDLLLKLNKFIKGSLQLISMLYNKEIKEEIYNNFRKKYPEFANVSNSIIDKEILNYTFRCEPILNEFKLPPLYAKSNLSEPSVKFEINSKDKKQSAFLDMLKKMDEL